MANISDKLVAMACPLGFFYIFLAIAAAQSSASTPAPVLDTAASVSISKGIAVSLFPYPYPGHVELFEGVDPKEMTSATSSTQHPFLQENILITKLVPDPSSDSFFYIDVYSNSIYRWNNVTTTLNDQTVSTVDQTSKVFEGLSRAICKLEYDYLTGNLYWSDPLLHWIGVMNVESNDRRDIKLLLTDDVDYVAALTLDVESGYLFWVSSAYEDGKMERSNLHGGDRKVIISNSLGFVDDMALDMHEKKLYWVDSYRMTVESAGYDGNGRRIVRRLVGTEFTSIAVIESNICLINFDDFEMQCMYKTSGDRYAYHSFYPSNPYAVGFFNPDVQKTPLENKCATKSCDQICINTDTQPKCLCRNGYTLNPNGLTCSETNPMYETAVVMINTTHICMIQVSSLSSSSPNKPIRCEETNATKDATHVQAHVAKNLLYYTAKSKEPTSMNKTQLLLFDLSDQIHYVVVPDMEEPDDIAYDWIGEKMFTCHSRLNLIKAWDVVTKLSSIIYQGDSVAQVSEITIDPHRDNIFWIAKTSNGLGVFLGTFTGQAPVRLVNSGSLTLPTGLSFEYLEDSVCFLDSGRFFTVNVNGTITNHRISVGSATQTLIYKNYAIWNSGPATLKMSLYSLDAIIYTTVTTMGTILSMTLFASEAQKSYLDPCKRSNGGCDDLCFRREATAVCQCDFGRTLKADNRGCSADPLLNDFHLVTDLSHDRIVQVSSDGQKIITLPLNNVMTPAMARYGFHDDLLYWSEVGSRSIRRGKLDGTHSERLISVGGDTYPDRFAIDFTTNQLYYTVAHTSELDMGYIAVMIPTKDQTVKKTLIKGLHYVGGLAIHPGKGYLYFNNHGLKVYIGRADSDGTNIKDIVTFNDGGTPLGMAIDYANEMLYWADAYRDQDKIEYINLDGVSSTRGVLRSDMTADIVDLALSDGYLYYVGYNRHRIIKVNLQNQQLEDFMNDQPEFGACDSTDVIPTTNTQPENTQCGSNMGMCSHFCFAKPTGKRCGCPDEMYLDQNTQMTCTTIPPKCPLIIPNGQLNPGCSALSGTSCGYSCYTTFMKNPAVSILNCTSQLFWDVPTDSLCIEKVCDTNMNNGNLLDCKGKEGESCTWQCPTNFIKKPLIEAVVCLSNGQWSTPLDGLCVPILVMWMPLIAHILKPTTIVLVMWMPLIAHILKPTTIVVVMWVPQMAPRLKLTTIVIVLWVPLMAPRQKLTTIVIVMLMPLMAPRQKLTTIVIVMWMPLMAPRLKLTTIVIVMWMPLIAHILKPTTIVVVMWVPQMAPTLKLTTIVIVMRVPLMAPILKPTTIVIVMWMPLIAPRLKLTTIIIVMRVPLMAQRLKPTTIVIVMWMPLMAPRQKLTTIVIVICSDVGATDGSKTKTHYHSYSDVDATDSSKTKTHYHSYSDEGATDGSKTKTHHHSYSDVDATDGSKTKTHYHNYSDVDATDGSKTKTHHHSYSDVGATDGSKTKTHDHSYSDEGATDGSKTKTHHHSYSDVDATDGSKTKTHHHSYSDVGATDGSKTKTHYHSYSDEGATDGSNTKTHNHSYSDVGATDGSKTKTYHHSYSDEGATDGSKTKTHDHSCSDVGATDGSKTKTHDHSCSDVEATCPNIIPNGYLQDCAYNAGASCQVGCNDNYISSVDYIHCLPDGIWDINVQSLCTLGNILVKTCGQTIPNGSFQNCNYQADKSCKVICSLGYSSTIDFIHCLPDGVWEKELKDICQLTKVVTPEKQTAAANTAGLTAAVAVVVTLLIIVIALGVAFFFCRRRIFNTEKQGVQGRYRASPNVYFNASDSRGEAPAQGFSNPTLQASNGEVMPNTNPLKLDQISLSDDTTKQNLQNEGHYDSIKDGQPVAGAGPHEAVNPLYSTMQPNEEMQFSNAGDVPEKPGYHRFN
ncbi:uncharacterized protein LOC132554425 [Ylistrum balloti]|uniref:uncharacterized protein LOC132554425 n=1 Tax=Ylistrum balloti TaxID=509963 RepID=UPI002905A26A|nr:uncharacterized protein LOC132554425 [Ylistrum balloti]